MRTYRISAACTAVLLLAGCAGEGNEPTEPTATAQEGVDAEGTASTDADADTGSDADADTGSDADAGIGSDADADAGADDGDADEPDEDAGDEAPASSRDVPEDVTLDVEQRHPSGAVLRVDRVRFEDVVIYVDFELLNGSQQFEQSFNFYLNDQLRVIDDVGNRYNVVPPEGEDLVVAVEQGESVGASFAFYGPVAAEATELTFLVNVAPDEAESWSLEDGNTGTYTPGFVVDGVEVRR